MTLQTETRSRGLPYAEDRRPPRESVSSVPSKEAGCGTFYIPERLTPLAFTSIYGELSDAQRTRYNQLAGLYYLEQIIYFEQCMGRPVLDWFEANAPGTLRLHAGEFREEEDRHTSWFRQLLRESEPRLYATGDFHLLYNGRLARVALNFCVHRPQWFACLLWIQIIAEERSQYFSGAFISAAGEVDPRFVELQRRHLLDEGGHIQWDVEFIEWLWPTLPLYMRKLNAALLAWLLREFFHLPKRSGWNVIKRLIVEFPELASRKEELRTAMRSLAKNEAYLRTLYPRCVFPKTRHLANRWPELRFLEAFFTK